MLKQPSQPVAVGIRVQKALNGVPIPVIIGQHRLPGNILWYNGFDAKKVNAGKGGKGGQYLLYTANAIVGLCQGPVGGLAQLWTPNGTFTTAYSTEQFTVPSGGGGYLPTNISQFLIDLGVFKPQTINVQVNDYGSPGTSSINQSTNVPYQNGVTVPAAPSLSSVSGGTIGATTYYVKITYIINGVESLASIESSEAVSANYLLKVSSPVSVSGATGWNVYVGTSSGNETKQNASPIAIGTNWIESTSGLIAGAAPPSILGAYGIDTAGNYIFSAADAGTQVTINYGFSLQYIYTAETYNIPGSGPYQQRISQYQNYEGDETVFFYPSGVQLTKVSGTPATGQYQVQDPGQSGQGTFTFSAADANKEILIKYKYKDTSILTQALERLNFSFFNGAKSQAPWSFVLNTGSEIGYTEICYVAASPWQLGQAAEFPNYNFEILGFYPAGGGINDANPIDAIVGLLTDPIWGLGFPTAALQSGDTIGPLVSGSWTNPTANNWFPNYFNEARAWCGANGLFISKAISSQQSAATIISEWLEACMLMCFFSEGVMKIRAMGDTSIAGNGYLYVPSTQPIVDLDDSAYLDKKQPVKMSSKPWEDAYNRVQINYANRLNSYAPDIVYEQDEASVALYGTRFEGAKTWDFLTNVAAATAAANLRVKRSVYIRNQYHFRLPVTYAYLEPMDLVTITDPNLGLYKTPVRIMKIADDPKKGLTIDAEEFPWGTASATLYSKQVYSPFVPIYGQQDPGNTQASIFEVPNRETLNPNADTVYIACNSATGNPNWGSAVIYWSKDNVNYTALGTCPGPARVGVLAQSLALASDPDTTDTLVVTMNQNSDALDAGTDAEADNYETRCAIVDASGTVEIISYGSASVTGPNQYSMTYLRRGILGTTPLAHSAGAAFFVLDDNVFEFTYDPVLYGATIYLKFLSFNHYGQQLQTLSEVTAVTFGITGHVGSGALGLESFSSSNLSAVAGAPLPIPPAPPAGWPPNSGDALGAEGNSVYVRSKLLEVV
jgi:hypothetical protein